VIAQTPEGGTGAQLGSLVTLQVSSGVAPIVKVPRVIGLSEDDARAALEEAGFLVEVVQVETDDPDKIGVVVQQTPGGGVKAEAGTTVTLKVGVEPGGDGGGEGWAELSRRAWP
jgi:serine/threonine-protein kinase